MTSRLRRATLDAREIAEAAEMIRVLGHPVRLRLVEALEHGERCVSDLQQTLNASQAVVSQQLAKMRAAGIVTCRRDGVNMCYTVADERVLQVLDCLRNCGTPARLVDSKSARGKPTRALNAVKAKESK